MGRDEDLSESAEPSFVQTPFTHPSLPHSTFLSLFHFLVVVILKRVSFTLFNRSAPFFSGELPFSKGLCGVYVNSYEPACFLPPLLMNI